jgi:hypothetical protein
MVAVEIRIVVLGGSDGVRNERRSDDRGAPGVVAILIDGGV